MASLAAILTKSGVAKSGSPKLILITFTPFSFNSFPSLAIARVSDSDNFCTLWERKFIQHDPRKMCYLPRISDLCQIVDEESFFKNVSYLKFT